MAPADRPRRREAARRGGNRHDRTRRRPCFTDKVARLGIRTGDLIDPEAFRARLDFVLPYKNAVLAAALRHARRSTSMRCSRTYSALGARLTPFVRDTAQIVHEALDRDETVLLEGAQGCLLDLDAGTYEYVTSSVPSSSAGGAGIGIGIGPTVIQQVVGIYKAYVTRVGNGPMPSRAARRDRRDPAARGPAARRSASTPAGRDAPAGSMPSRRATARWSTA